MKKRGTILSRMKYHKIWNLYRKKPHVIFFYRRLNIEFQQEVCWSSPKSDLETNILKLENRGFENVIFLKVNLKQIKDQPLVNSKKELPSPLYAHVHFWATPSPTHDAYIKSPCQPTPNHLTRNAFKYAFIKSYQTVDQLKNNRKQQGKYCFMFLMRCIPKNSRSFFQLICTQSDIFQQFVGYLALAENFQCSWLQIFHSYQMP